MFVPNIFENKFAHPSNRSQQVSRKTTSHYLDNWVTKQNIRYLLEDLPSFGNKVLSSIEKELQEPIYLKLVSVIFLYFTKRKHFKN